MGGRSFIGRMGALFYQLVLHANAEQNGIAARWSSSRWRGHKAMVCGPRICAFCRVHIYRRWDGLFWQGTNAA
jgi:hypothetical protein